MSNLLLLLLGILYTEHTYVDNLFARPWVGPIPGFVTSLSVECLSTISRFKELRLSKVSNASSVSLGSTRVSLGCH
jgi:hypothetical protein